MSGKALFEGMSYVDERFVDEAENQTLPKRTVAPWMKAASVAACLCLIVFSIFHLNQFLHLGPAGGLTGEGAADGALPGEGVESVIEAESQESSIIAPEVRPTGEGPSVILRVDEMTDIGFTGTVAAFVDTDILEIGMELNVIVADGTRNETFEENPVVSEGSEESMVSLTGTYVMVRFIEYDEETQTIVINILQEVEPPETVR